MFFRKSKVKNTYASLEGPIYQYVLKAKQGQWYLKMLDQNPIKFMAKKDVDPRNINISDFMQVPLTEATYFSKEEAEFMEDCLNVANLELNHTKSLVQVQKLPWKLRRKPENQSVYAPEDKNDPFNRPFEQTVKLITTERFAQAVSQTDSPIIKSWDILPGFKLRALKVNAFRSYCVKAAAYFPKERKVKVLLDGSKPEPEPTRIACEIRKANN